MSKVTAHHRQQIRQALDLYRQRGEWDGKSVQQARRVLSQARYTWAPWIKKEVEKHIASRAHAKKSASATKQKTGEAAPGSLDHYLQLANHAARWASPQNPFAAHPTLRSYMRRVPRESFGHPVDRGFWLGEVLDDLRRDAERDLSPAELKRFDSVARLVVAKPPPGYGSAASGRPVHAKTKKSKRQLDREIAEALAGKASDTGSVFYDFLLERFPSGDVPWPWVEKILTKHGVPLPLMIGLGKEEAEQYGVRQGKSADVHQLARFLGY